MATNQKTVSVTAGNSVATTTTKLSDNLPAIPCPDPAGYKYVGARYVPLFAEPIEWDETKQTTYEPLTIVLYQGNSYTSKQYVPTGIDITNENFWAETGNYNAQLELYRREAQKALNLAKLGIKTYPSRENNDYTNLEIGDLIYFEGFNSPGDGGNGFFILSDQQDNSIYSFQDISLPNYYFNAFIFEYFNIGVIGTTNDNTTDNTSLINSWINDLTENVNEPIIAKIPYNCYVDASKLNKMPLGSELHYSSYGKDGNYIAHFNVIKRSDSEINDSLNVIQSGHAPHLTLHNLGDQSSNSSKLGRAGIHFSEGWKELDKGYIPHHLIGIGGTYTDETKETYALTVRNETDHSNIKTLFIVNNDGYVVVGSKYSEKYALNVSDNNAPSCNGILELKSTKATNNYPIIDINANGGNLNLRSLTTGAFNLRRNTNVLATLNPYNGIVNYAPIIPATIKDITENAITLTTFPFTIIGNEASGDINTININESLENSSNIIICKLIFETTNVKIVSGGNIQGKFTPSKELDTCTIMKHNAYSSAWVILDA